MADDGLSWLMELDAKVDGPKAMLGVLDRLNKTLEQVDKSFRRVEGDTKKLDGAMKAGAKSTWLLGGALKAAGSAALGFVGGLAAGALTGIVSGFTSLAGKVANIGEEMITTAAKAERTASSFKLLLGADKGSELLDYLDGIAKHTEFTDDALKGAVQGLLKAGFAAREIPRALAAGLDIASFSANAEEGLGGALAALERIRRTGKIENRALAGLGLGEKDFLAELSKRTGVGVKTLKERLEKGRVDVQESVEALYSIIARRTGRDLGGAGVALSSGLGARLTHLKDLPDQYFQRLAESPAFTRLGNVLGNVLEGLDPDSPRGRKIFGGLERSFSRIVDMVAKVDIDKVMTKTLQVLEAMPAALQSVIALLRDLVDIAKGLGVVGKFIHDYTPIGLAYDVGKENRARKLAGAPTMLDNLIQNYTPVGFIRDRFGKGGKNAADGMAKGLQSGAADVAAAAGMCGTAAIQSMETTLQSRSPSRVFEKLGEMSAAGYVKGLAGADTSVDLAVKRSFDVSHEMLPPSSTARPRAGLGGNVSVSMPITVNVDGGGADGDVIASRVRDAVHAEVRNLLEGLQLEAGS